MRSHGMVMTLHRLSELFVQHGVPEPIPSDNGLSWENAYTESLNGKLRDELLNGEIFETRWEATILIEHWRQAYNRIRPHSALGYRPPTPETIVPQYV